MSDVATISKEMRELETIVYEIMVKTYKGGGKYSVAALFRGEAKKAKVYDLDKLISYFPIEEREEVKNFIEGENYLVAANQN
jgi:hypothetical protein